MICYLVKSTIIDFETIQGIVVDLSSNEEDVAQECIQVIFNEIIKIFFSLNYHIFLIVI
jgi:hypothetical protein